MPREIGAASAVPHPNPPGDFPSGKKVSARVHRKFASFKNAKVTTIESPLSPNDRVFPYLLVFTRNNGTTNSDFVLVGEVGNAVIDLGVGDSILLTDTAPQEVYLVANSGTQTVYAMGWGDPEGE